MIDANLPEIAAAFGSVQVVKSLFGPTLDLLGARLRTFTESQIENARSMFENANEKVGDRIKEPGSIPPRVLGAVLEQGSLSADELSIEYFGGVLASSRSDTARDDRGATFANLVSRLSCYEIRAHYVIYSIIRRVFDGRSYSVRHTPLEMQTFIPEDVYTSAMDFSNSEDIDDILDHVIRGLCKEELIAQDFLLGPFGLEKSKCSPNDDRLGITITPSPRGIELYQWVHGLGHMSLANFLKHSFEFQTKIIIPHGSRPMRVPKDDESPSQGT